MKFINIDWIKKLLKGCCAFFLLFYSEIFILIPKLLFKINLDSLKNNYRALSLLSTFSGICISICFILLYRKDLIKEFKKFKKNILSNLNTGLICWITGLIIMMAANFVLVFVLKSGGANNENAIQKYIKAAPLFIALDICLFGPFNEEIVFRKAIKDVIKNKYLFVFLSFLLFGGAHVISSAKNIVDFLYIIPYGTLGAVFAIAYNKTDTVFTSTAFHMVHNTLLFMISVLI